MGISIGLVGLGVFGTHFAELFKEHPLVDRVALCDREPERVKKIAELPYFSEKFNPKDAFYSLEDICKSDLDALVIQTQPWLHAPQCLEAMRSGKHVYSAVPVSSVPDGDEILDWCDKLVQASLETGMHYMLGETTYYHPETMFCRRKAAEGAFGDFIYAEGNYMHDVDSGCNLREVVKYRTASAAGREWLSLSQKYFSKGIKSSPMHYPTHSVSGPVSVMNAHALKVNAYGYRNRNNDPYFKDYDFSNETALFKMSNGAVVRICEFREFGGVLCKGEGFEIIGSKAAYAEQHTLVKERDGVSPLDVNHRVWKENFRHNCDEGRPAQSTIVSVEEQRDKLPLEVEMAFKKITNRGIDEADLQNIDFNPVGHEGSHPYLVHEFVDAIANGRRPAINIWEAARYMAMGVTAHKSALNDGETLEVPDWGDAPA